jgi:Leucine-rich repeat (LRR) protein
MHLKGKEKHFWKSWFNISSLVDIPLEISGFKAIDDEVEDQDLLYLTSRIRTIHGIYLKFTHVTDDGVKHISTIQNLSELTLREHKNITNASIPYLNKLVDLEYLDILKTEIQLEDLPGLFNLQNLKELYVTSENLEEEYLLEHVITMKEILPNCILYINYESYE